MFRGVNTLNLDAKGRLAIPTRYREPLRQRCDGQLILTTDLDRCLLLYPLPEWEEIEYQLMRLSAFDKKVREVQRLLVGHATECELDGNGRILLPPLLREFARLEKRVVLLGQGKKFEIWDEVAWNQRQEALEGEGLGDLMQGAGLENIAL
ncbi:MAG: division/cell wall cluster transcriptional repressor MraZ [Gammaproteobacteria bacterium]